MRVSVVVPTFNGSAALAECLESLRALAVDGGEVEVIVVDDASRDGTPEMVARDFPRVICLRHDANRGPGAARNTGWRAARGEVIAFVDSDVTVDCQWLAKGLPYFADPTVGGVEGRTVVSRRELISPFTHWTQNLHGGLFPTCNMFYRRHVLEQVGGFDERFYDSRTRVHFREDIDLAFTVLDQGWRIPFAAEAVVYHPPLHPRYVRPLKLAQRYYFDGLLERKHPDRFQECVEKHWLGPIIVRRPRYYVSFLHVLSAVGLVVGLASGRKPLAVLAAATYVLTLGLGLAAPIRHRRVAAIPASDYAAAVPIFAAVPWVHVYWILKGKWHFRRVGTRPTLAAERRAR